MAGSFGLIERFLPVVRADASPRGLSCHRVACDAAGKDDARDNRAHDEELSPTALNKLFAPNEWQRLTGLR
jgi:hypothetical protein